VLEQKALAYSSKQYGIFSGGDPPVGVLGS